MNIKASFLNKTLELSRSSNSSFNLVYPDFSLTWRYSPFSYLHGCVPPIVHGNLTCDTIFIQHNGLVKIGSVAPDAIHHHVKTCRENMRNMHFIAPEYGCKYH